MTCCANRSSHFPPPFPPLSPARWTPGSQLLHQGFVDTVQSSQGAQGPSILPPTCPLPTGTHPEMLMDCWRFPAMDTFTPSMNIHPSPRRAFQARELHEQRHRKVQGIEGLVMTPSPTHLPEVSFSSPWPQRSLLPGPVDTEAQLRSGAFPSDEAGEFLGPNTLGGT